MAKQKLHLGLDLLYMSGVSYTLCAEHDMIYIIPDTNAGFDIVYDAMLSYDFGVTDDNESFFLYT